MKTTSLEYLVWTEKYYPWWESLDKNYPVTYQWLAELSVVDSSQSTLQLVDNVDWLINTSDDPEVMDFAPFPIGQTNVFLSTLKKEDCQVALAYPTAVFGPYRKYIVGLLRPSFIEVIGVFYQMGWQLSAKAWLAECVGSRLWPALSFDVRTASMMELLPEFIECVTAVRRNHAEPVTSPIVAWLLLRGDSLATDMGFQWSSEAKGYTL